MKMRGKNVPEEPVADPTAWLVTGTLPEFILLHTYYIKCLVMFGYTFLHGYKLFPTFPSTASRSFKIVSMIFQCTGGGILVPICINAIPVPMAQDAYPIAILTSYLLHENFAILREILKLSSILKMAFSFLYEVMRASVVVKLTVAANAAIAPSDFSIAVFGPIFCGTMGGCGGAFLPFNKGLDPIQQALGQPMWSALLGATFYHLFVNTSLSDGVLLADKKAHVLVAAFFILTNWHASALLPLPKKSSTSEPSSSGGSKKKETKKTK